MENQPPNSVEPESTRVFFKGLFSWFDKVTKYKRFRRTRQYIKQGKKLFDLPADELSKINAMGPWTFNIYQTMLAAIPAQIVATVLNFFFPYEPPLRQITKSLSPYQKEFIRDFDKLAPSVHNYFRPLIVPTILLAVSSIAGWACLKKEDSTKQSRKRCRNAYLYYDGAYGLMPQTIISLAITMLAMSNERNVDAGVVYFLLIGLVIGLGASIYQLYVTDYKIPSLLFHQNGYSTSVFLPSHSKFSAPWGKYGYSTLFLIGPISWLIVWFFHKLEILVLIYLVNFRMWLKGLV